MRLSLKTRGKSRFFLLHQNAMNTHKASKALSDLMADFTNVDSKAGEIVSLARLGSEIAQQTSAALHDTPPDRRLTLGGPTIGRRDALRLARRMQSMSASVARAATAMNAGDAANPTDTASNMAASVAQCARHLEGAIGALSAGGDGRPRAMSSADAAAACADAAHLQASTAREPDGEGWADVHAALAKAAAQGHAAAAMLRAVARKG